MNGPIWQTPYPHEVIVWAPLHEGSQYAVEVSGESHYNTVGWADTLAGAVAIALDLGGLDRSV